MHPRISRSSSPGHRTLLEVIMSDFNRNVLDFHNTGVTAVILAAVRVADIPDGTVRYRGTFVVYSHAGYFGRFSVYFRDIRRIPRLDSNFSTLFNDSYLPLSYVLGKYSLDNNGIFKIVIAACRDDRQFDYPFYIDEVDLEVFIRNIPNFIMVYGRTLPADVSSESTCSCGEVFDV